MLEIKDNTVIKKMMLMSVTVLVTGVLLFAGFAKPALAWPPPPCSGCCDWNGAECIPDDLNCEYGGEGCESCVDCSCVDDDSKCNDCQVCQDGSCVKDPNVQCDDDSDCLGCRSCIDCSCVDDDNNCDPNECCIGSVCVSPGDCNVNMQNKTADCSYDSELDGWSWCCCVVDFGHCTTPCNCEEGSTLNCCFGGFYEDKELVEDAHCFDNPD